MKFPSQSDHDSDHTASSDAPNVTSGVLDRLGISDEPSRSAVPRGQAVRQVFRFRFVIVLGGIILASALWKSFTPSGDSIELVEQFPQTIEQGRATRAQLLMGFMAPFEQVDRAITAVGRGGDSSALTGVSGSNGLLEEPPVFFKEGQSAPTEVDILEASAPFPSS